MIEIAGLRKGYRRLRGGTHRALDGFDMLVEPGQVHGFLGPNGSGKTTTLRALLGLVRADAGEMRILGHSSPSALPQVIGRVGAIVESPQFFGNFSGRRMLSLLATAGGVPQTRVEEVLAQVGLRERGKDIIKTYSLGMKQRLAVASALLKAPELLILDEPANGLDPAGIREMRELVRALAAQGVTVLISSHILGEIQLICDSVTIISRGRRVLAGPVSGVLDDFDRGDFRIRVSDLPRAAQALSAAGVAVTAAPDHLVAHRVTEPARLTELLGGQGLWISELSPLTPDLESVFLRLTDTAPASGEAKQVDDSVLPPAPPSALNEFTVQPEVPR
ncbi:ABC-2 type transport system ATP-binding protein [Catenuloplanes atrovinosus]|uniref:ABC-2 type transport system ATP-binding protein n=1 Tax=Catenuloplanes atrovinosus TaxID=137266 RepID=A0AAE3YWQ5_9ACTN|nr:ABC-2 type transport system ATP-binding protein [Catenuloplanes atrovinosus]